MLRFFRAAFGVCTAVAALAISACTGSENSNVADLAGLSSDRPLFFTQTVVPDAVMDALFQGRVVEDAVGCLRQAPGNRVSIVWPKGFTLVERRGSYFVQNAKGQTVGRIGGEFRLGGGEVPFLHEGIALTSAVRKLATQRCPGIFWIVGQVSLP